MKKILLITFTILFSLNAQALFEVKDASDHSVFEITNDGIRIFNYPDTLMIISSDEIRANLDNSTKGLSRSFSVSTNATGKGALAHVLEVGTESTTMREGNDGNRYTDFSPENIFLGLNAGEVIDQGLYNIFIGNHAGETTTIDDDPFEFEMAAYNIFIGESAGKMATYSYQNTYIGMYSGYSNTDGMNNVFLGMESGVGNTGSQNTFIGSKVCANGYSAGASYNTFVGYESGLEIQGGYYNTFIGRQSGKNNVSGDRNVFIGNQVGYSETGSDKLYIDNSNTASPLIYGNFATNALTINGTLTTTGSSTVNGTFFRILNDPGTGTAPINYVTQGGSSTSTAKAFAFTIKDALWVTSNAFFDGTMNIPSLYTTTSSNSRKYVFVDTNGKLCVSAKNDGNLTDNEDVESLKSENKKQQAEIEYLKSEIEEIKKLLNK